jgi:hypothetical protein
MGAGVVVVVIGNNVADTESVVSKEDIHVQHRMVADRTYSEDKQTWKLLFSTQKRLNELTVNCYQGRQDRGVSENGEYTLKTSHSRCGTAMNATSVSMMMVVANKSGTPGAVEKN